MTKRIVLGIFGDSESLMSVRDAAGEPGTEVIAVALEVGNGVSLSQLKEAALAAGAAKCHALDLREEYAREVLVQSLRAGAQVSPDLTLPALAAAFVSRKLREIAVLEQAVPVTAPTPTTSRAVRYEPVGPTYIELQFAGGEPVALNDIPMMLPELMESLETITGASALDVLSLAYQELGDADEGHIALRAQDGTCVVMPSAVLA